jgi:hypothetical protein
MAAPPTPPTPPPALAPPLHGQEARDRDRRELQPSDKPLSQDMLLQRWLDLSG